MNDVRYAAPATSGSFDVSHTFGCKKVDLSQKLSIRDKTAVPTVMPTASTGDDKEDDEEDGTSE